MNTLLALEGKRALVAGGGLGIGRASARLLAQCGAAVAVADLDGARANEATAELRAMGGVAIGIAADLREPAQAERAVAEAAQALGGLDILVNIIGQTGERGALADMPPERLENALSVNLRHHVYTCAAFIRHLRSAKSGGAIVMTGSLAGVLGAPGLASYGASKAALISLTRTLAVECGPLGIRVNCVVPGMINTDRSRKRPEVVEKARAVIPLGRVGEQEEVAKAILFLASDLASYVSGQILVTDGGQTVLGAFDKL